MALDADGGGYSPSASIPQMGTTAAQQGMSFDPSDPMNYTIYLGTREREGFDSQEAKVANQLGYTYAGEVIKKRKTLSIGNLLTAFDSFSRKEFLYVRNRLAAAGYVSPDAMPVDVRTAYAYALEDAAIFQASRPNVSFHGYLDNLIRMSGKDPSKLGSRAKKWTTTSKATSVYELDGGEARSIMSKALQEYLGRDPSKGEIRDFMNAVDTAAEEDPSSRTTTTSYATRADGTTRSTSSDTETHAGYTSDDAMWEAIDKAKASPDYGEYQAVSNYFPIIEQLLGASVAM